MSWSLRAAQAVRAAGTALPLWAWVMLGYLLLAVVATWPLAMDLGGHIYGNASGDGIGGIAYFNSWKASILQGHPGRDPLLSYPFGADLRSSPVPPFYFAVELLLTFVLGGVGAYNLLALLCFPLSAMAAYILCRVLKFSAAPAAAAGVFYGFSSYHAAHAAGHTTLPHTEFFALVLAALLVWRNRGGLRRGLLVSLALTATLTWDFYFAVFVMLLLGAAGLAWLVTDTVRRGFLSALVGGLQLAAIGLVGVALATPLFLLVKSGVQAGALSGRISGEILAYSATPCQMLRPWSSHPQLAQLGCPSNGLPPAEVGLYLGMVALDLTIFFLVTTVRRGLPGSISREIWVVAPIALVGLAWAVPAVWQRYLHTSPPGILWQYIPGLRVNSRAVVLVQLAVAVLAGAGLERLIGAPRTHRSRASRGASGQTMTAKTRRMGWLISGAAATIFFFESIGISSAANPLPLPPVNDWLVSQPRGTVIMQYPAAWPGTVSEGTGYFYSYYHDRYLLPEIGTSLGAPNEGMDLAVELWASDPNTAGELSAMGVKYAVSHTGKAYDLRSKPDVLRGLPGLQTVFSSNGDTVYKVTAAPRPFAYLTGDFQVLEGPSPSNYARWMGASGRVALENPYPQAISGVLRLDMLCLGDCRSQVVVRGDGADQQLTQGGPVDIHLRMPPGRSYVELVPPNPPRRISAVDDRLVTLYVFRPVLTTSALGTR